MDITPTTLILVGVVCVILGFLASVLINTLSEDANEPIEAGNDTPPGGRKGRYTPLVRLWREKGNGTLVVEIDGKSLVAPDLLTSVQRERLEKSVRDLHAWLGGGLLAVKPQPGPQQAAVPAGEPDSAGQDLRRMIEPSSVGTRQAYPGQTASTAQPARPHAVPPPAPVPTPPQPVNAKGNSDAASAPIKSMVSQIEEILQSAVAGTPLEDRDIHLREDPVRGVIVQVGHQYFEGIESVSDPEIRKVIRSAVQAWEQTQ